MKLLKTKSFRHSTAVKLSNPPDAIAVNGILYVIPDVSIIAYLMGKIIFAMPTRNFLAMHKNVLIY